MHARKDTSHNLNHNPLTTWVLEAQVCESLCECPLHEFDPVVDSDVSNPVTVHIRGSSKGYI